MLNELFSYGCLTLYEINEINRAAFSRTRKVHAAMNTSIVIFLYHSLDQILLKIILENE